MTAALQQIMGLHPAAQVATVILLWILVIALGRVAWEVWIREGIIGLAILALLVSMICSQIK